MSNRTAIDNAWNRHLSDMEHYDGETVIMLGAKARFYQDRGASASVVAAIRTELREAQEAEERLIAEYMAKRR